MISIQVHKPLDTESIPFDKHNCVTSVYLFSSRVGWWLTLISSRGGTQKMKKFLVTIERDEDGWFVIECPALPGCVSQGRTMDEALANIREAIQGCLESRVAHDLPLGLEIAEVEVEAPA